MYYLPFSNYIEAERTQIWEALEGEANQRPGENDAPGYVGDFSSLLEDWRSMQKIKNTIEKEKEQVRLIKTKKQLLLKYKGHHQAKAKINACP